MESCDKSFVCAVDRWEKEKPWLFIAFLTGVAIVTPLIDGALTVYEGVSAARFFLRHKRWPGPCDLYHGYLAAK